jgi:hypothetical protein
MLTGIMILGALFAVRDLWLATVVDPTFSAVIVGFGIVVASIGAVFKGLPDTF